MTANFNRLHTPAPRTATHRIIQGLQHAWESADPAYRVLPTYQRNSSLSPRQKEGLRYEEKVRKLLPEGSRKGVWFEYMDKNGKGLCQPDWLCPLDRNSILIVECKRTECPEATTQLTQLYFPIVKKALGVEPFGLVIAQFLTPLTPKDRLFSDFEVAWDAAQIGGTIPILHWIK